MGPSSIARPENMSVQFAGRDERRAITRCFDVSSGLGIRSVVLAARVTGQRLQRDTCPTVACYDFVGNKWELHSTHVSCTAHDNVPPHTHPNVFPSALHSIYNCISMPTDTCAHKQEGGRNPIRGKFMDGKLQGVSTVLDVGHNTKRGFLLS